MTKPDLQYFDDDGTWVKPPGAARVTVVLKGGDDGGTFFTHYLGGDILGSGGQVAAAPAHGADDAELVVRSYRAGAWPRLVSVRAGGGGWALVVTHLEPDKT